MTSKPQFVGQKVRLGELIKKAKIEHCGNRSFPVYSMTMHNGIVKQSGRFKKMVASQNQSAYKIVRKGQLVVGFPIDEGVIYVQNFEQPGIMSPAYNIWDFDKSRILPGYLELALHSPQSMAYYADKMRGTTARRRTLTAEGLRSMLIPLPSIERQGEIVEVLSGIKKQILLAQKRIDGLDSLVKSRFVEMFEGKDYPVSRLFNLTSSMRNGLSPSKSGSHHSRVLTLSAVTQGCFNSLAWKDGFFAEKPPADKHVSVGDFYVCRGNGNIHLVGLGEYPDRTMEDVVFPDTMIAAKIKQEQIILPYLKYAWVQPSTRKQIEAVAKTTNGTFKINQTTLGNIKVPVPPHKIQQEFADFVRQVDKSRFVAQQQIEKLQLLYDSLAQEYFGD